MATPFVDLNAIDTEAEIIVRAGDATRPEARLRLQEAYKRRDVVHFPDAPGASILFRTGASLDELAREGQFLHGKISHAKVARIVEALADVGCAPVLFITPAPEEGLPDHHSLAVAREGAVLPELPEAAADALLHVLKVIDNPYRRRKPKP